MSGFLVGLLCVVLQWKGILLLGLDSEWWRVACRVPLTMVQMAEMVSGYETALRRFDWYSPGVEVGGRRYLV